MIYNSLKLEATCVDQWVDKLEWDRHTIGYYLLLTKTEFYNMNGIGDFMLGEIK